MPRDQYRKLTPRQMAELESILGAYLDDLYDRIEAYEDPDDEAEAQRVQRLMVSIREGRDIRFV